MTRGAGQADSFVPPFTERVAEQLGNTLFDGLPSRRLDRSAAASDMPGQGEPRELVAHVLCTRPISILM